MKKNKTKILILLVITVTAVLFTFNHNALAATVSCSVSKSNVAQGEQITFIGNYNSQLGGNSGSYYFDEKTDGLLMNIISSGNFGFYQYSVSTSVIPSSYTGEAGGNVDFQFGVSNYPNPLRIDCGTVYVNPLPQVTFSASPTTITSGQSTTLSWTTTNTTAVSIVDNNSNDVGSNLAVNGSYSVSPTQTMLYTITATGLGGSATAEVGVGVSPTGNCTAPSASVSSGSGVTFSSSFDIPSSAKNIIYTFYNNGVMVGYGPDYNTPGLTSNIANGQYTVIVKYNNGLFIGTSQSASCPGVIVIQPAPIVTFSASPTTITAGQSATLTWTTTNATAVSIDNGIGSVATSSGSQSVSPTVSTTYTITATGASGTTPATAQATITVTTVTQPPNPTQSPAPIVTFSASPTTITAGQSATLTWTTTNATAVSIDNGIGSVATSSGSQSVSPTVSTTYTITATGASGTTPATAQATITVNPVPKLSPISISASGAPSGATASAPILYNGETYTITSPSGGDIYYTYINSSGGSSYPNGSLLGTASGSSLSGTFSSSTARIIEFWAASNSVKSDPIDVAVIPAPPSAQSQQTAPALEIDCQRSVTKGGKTATDTIASLVINPGVVVPPNNTTTLTLSFYPKTSAASTINGQWGCSVPIIDENSNHTTSPAIDWRSSTPNPYSKVATVTQDTNYELSCTTSGTTSDGASVCDNYLVKNKGNIVSSGPPINWVTVKVFGGSTGGIKEIAPQ